MATIMASRGRPSSALATDPYITVNSHCILARNPPVDSPLTLSPNIPNILSPTPARNAADVGLSRLYTVRSAVLLPRWWHSDSRKESRSYGLRPGFDSCFNIEVRFLTLINSPKIITKNYKHDIRNGPSTNLPPSGTMRKPGSYLLGKYWQQVYPPLLPLCPPHRLVACDYLHGDSMWPSIAVCMFVCGHLHACATILRFVHVFMRQAQARGWQLGNAHDRVWRGEARRLSQVPDTTPCNPQMSAAHSHRDKCTCMHTHRCACTSWHPSRAMADFVATACLVCVHVTCSI